MKKLADGPSVYVRWQEQGREVDGNTLYYRVSDALLSVSLDISAAKSPVATKLYIHIQ
jgi:hypothetical protein